MQRSTAKAYPWYDSIWLDRYVSAKTFIAERHPQRLQEFVDTFACLRTRPDFSVCEIPRVFDEATLAMLRQTIADIPMSKMELHEANSFKRFVVHDHETFTKLQKTTEAMVGELAGEEVESNYNFLSLYSSRGVCPIHMDSPESKWTLDICIDQNVEWPIQFSQVVPWPETHDYGSDDYDRRIKSSPDLKFTSHTLHPGEAILFSGSSQWHYRDGIAGDGASSYCTLLFFHFVPKGMKTLIRPENWPKAFALPDLAGAVGRREAA